MIFERIVYHSDSRTIEGESEFVYKLLYELGITNEIPTSKKPIKVINHLKLIQANWNKFYGKILVLKTV